MRRSRAVGLRRMSALVVVGAMVSSCTAVAVASTDVSVSTTDSVDRAALELDANIELAHPALGQPDTGPPGEAPGDLAFSGDLAVVGRGIFSGEDRRYNGFVLFDISDPSRPRELSRFDCTNTGFDVSIWDDLVFLSQDAPSETDECGSSVPSGPLPPATVFAGLRIVSVADPHNPQLVASIRTGACRTDPSCATGSHTHTVVPELDREDPRLVVYVNSLPAGVVVVPLDDPAAAEYVGDISTLAGGLGGTNGCHDLQVLMAARLAACSSINEVSLWDISDPLAPVVFSHFSDPTIFHHHSAVFSTDGSTLVVQDESFYSLAAEISAVDDGCIDTDAGALRFYDITKTVDDYRAGKAMPAAPRRTAVLRAPTPTTERVQTWCYAHYGGVVPIPPGAGEVQNLLVMGWAGAGTWLVDFTDPAAPRFVGHYYDVGSATSSPSFTYSAYWYRGRIYANNGSLNVYGLDHRDTDRGLEVFRVRAPDTEYGRQLRDALHRAARQDHLNPQTQACIDACPIVTPTRWSPPPGITPAPPAARSSSPALYCTITLADLPRAVEVAR
jgi:hypothetical protein